MVQLYHLILLKVGFVIQDFISYYTTIINKIFNKVLDLIKQHQEERVIKNITIVKFNFQVIAKIFAIFSAVLPCLMKL